MKNTSEKYLVFLCVTLLFIIFSSTETFAYEIKGATVANIHVSNTDKPVYIYVENGTIDDVPKGSLSSLERDCCWLGRPLLFL